MQLRHAIYITNVGKILSILHQFDSARHLHDKQFKNIDLQMLNYLTYRVQ